MNPNIFITTAWIRRSQLSKYSIDCKCAELMVIQEFNKVPVNPVFISKEMLITHEIDPAALIAGLLELPNLRITLADQQDVFSPFPSVVYKSGGFYIYLDLKK